MIFRYTIVRFIGYFTIGVVGSLIQMSTPAFWAIVLGALIIEFSTRWETEEILIKMIKGTSDGSKGNEEV